MKNILVILSGLFMICFLPVYSANKQTTKFQENTPLEISSLYELNALLKNQKMVFIDFYKDECPPCKDFKPIYEGWAGLFGKEIIFIMVNGDSLEGRSLCTRFGVSRFPTLVILNNQGKEIAKHTELDKMTKINIKKLLVQAKD